MAKNRNENEISTYVNAFRKLVLNVKTPLGSMFHLGTTHSILVDYCQESLKDTQVLENIALASCNINKINSVIEKAHILLSNY